MRVLLRLTVVAAVLVLLWIAIPAARTVSLLQTISGHGAPARPNIQGLQDVRFAATDGVLLRGWSIRRSSGAPSIILVAGFKDSRSSMLPYARFLAAAGYNVLLYDGRGTGQSGGRFSLGAGEVGDVRGAVAYLRSRPDLPVHRYGLLGVSLGAGVVIAAAARLPSVRAVVADSAYADQHRTVDRLDSFHLGQVDLPLAPVAPALVDAWIGTPLASFSPLRAAPSLAPGSLLLIHSRHDTNPTTPLHDVLALRRAARGATLWIAPRGGHAGALAAQPAEYQRRVLSFFRQRLGAVR